eukprot:jgi/Botrbrau1/15793/Bobra.4_1s0144.1
MALTGTCVFHSWLVRDTKPVASVHRRSRAVATLNGIPRDPPGTTARDVIKQKALLALTKAVAVQGTASRPQGEGVRILGSNSEVGDIWWTKGQFVLAINVSCHHLHLQDLAIHNSCMPSPDILFMSTLRLSCPFKTNPTQACPPMGWCTHASRMAREGRRGSCTCGRCAKRLYLDRDSYHFSRHRGSASIPLAFL